ncbi:hypothetical protein RF11_09772 [Thelohanellus kitauei]|uniref:Uncharacterized protein n=1 Tax=Thelohanellus kitauei TaxID=669202 RepID=A0A0C2MK96_THEKT|nr:hypothetical protein RF11_09772 [Thelohanellus kitauei]
MQIIINIPTPRNRAIDEYLMKSVMNHLSIQMDAVKNVISHFWNQIDQEFDNIFIQNFPKELFDELDYISVSAAKDEIDLQKKVLFFEIFIFIFRNKDLIHDPRTRSFVELFLKFIKIRDPNLKICLNSLIQSIKNCIISLENKILFINENGMFHFYLYFLADLRSYDNLFWKMCGDIYCIPMDQRHRVCLAKHKIYIREIMSKIGITADIYSQILTMILKMISHLKLIHDIEFDVSAFYDITIGIIRGFFETMENHIVLIHLALIWTEIIQGSKNRFVIDTIEKLVHLSAIFSIDMSRKIKDVVDRQVILEFNKNEYINLDLIYFTLVAYPTIDDGEFKWLNSVLLDLHTSFQKYLDQKSIHQHKNEIRFGILQYFMKSFTTLNFEISSADKEFYRTFLDTTHQIPEGNF